MHGPRQSAMVGPSSIGEEGNVGLVLLNADSKVEKEKGRGRQRKAFTSASGVDNISLRDSGFVRHHEAILQETNAIMCLGKLIGAKTIRNEEETQLGSIITQLVKPIWWTAVFNSEFVPSIGSKGSRLDRFLVSTEWVDKFGGLEHHNLPRNISDHAFICLSSGVVDWGPSGVMDD
ncbi:hypothetical protein V6N12_035202 [Hibiscus sabdariffa]|uniref:Uncharacterized protein n=1 Tax=Hibiscus sabdariffa TaxID=183260 RepID=A0ABR2AM76_9ROSI